MGHQACAIEKFELMQTQVLFLAALKLLIKGYWLVVIGLKVSRHRFEYIDHKHFVIVGVWMLVEADARD